MGCGSDDSDTSTTSTEPPTTVCNPATYQGDAVTDPCGPVPEAFDVPPPVPAGCDTASYRYAMSSIDGNLRVLDAACDGSHLVARYGSDACAPESDLDADACINAHTAYFVLEGDRWDLRGVDDPSLCGPVVPDELCAGIEED